MRQYNAVKEQVSGALLMFRLIGDSPKAARYAGIDIKRNIIVVFAISGALAGLAGMSEVSGVVRSVPAGAQVKAGERVAAFCAIGGFAETAVAPEFFTFPLSSELDFAQGAGLILNYHTAYFSLALRGRLKAGETVLVHGAAGGVGTAGLQVAKALGARTIGLVSTEAKRQVAEEAGADQTVLVADGWKDEVKERSGGGVDVVLDPVGGDRFTDSIRSLREDGRLVVVGFTGGAIPEVRVNRLLLGNTEVVGAGWGAYVMGKPELNRELGRLKGNSNAVTR